MYHGLRSWKQRVHAGDKSKDTSSTTTLLMETRAIKDDRAAILAKKTSPLIVRVSFVLLLSPILLSRRYIATIVTFEIINCYFFTIFSPYMNHVA
jgi:hypothetical protein